MYPGIAVNSEDGVVDFLVISLYPYRGLTFGKCEISVYQDVFNVI